MKTTNATPVRFSGRKWTRDCFVLAAVAVAFGLPALAVAFAVAGIVVGQLGE